MLLANFNRKEHLRHRAVSLRQHGFLVFIPNFRFCYKQLANFEKSGHAVRLSIQRPARVAIPGHKASERSFQNNVTFNLEADLHVTLFGVTWEDAEDTTSDRSFWSQAAVRCALRHEWNKVYS